MENNVNVMQPANRISNQKPYFFANLTKRILALQEQGREVIRLDIGSPDLPPADFIIRTMTEGACKPNTHGYTPYGGTPAYRKAIVHYYGQRFGVELDWRSQVVGLIGSKEGLFTIGQVVLNPGDVSLVPDPSYITYTSSSEIAGAEVYKMPLLEQNNFLPDLDSIPEDILKRAKLLWLNYPNNPTGAIAPIEFFVKVVAFAQKHNLIIAHDAPYADICYDGYTAPSILQVPGAFDVAVEFNSLSKTYNMAGWRLGMAVGNPDLIHYIASYKEQVDTSHFEPILAGGIAALTGDQTWVQSRNQIYQDRRDAVVEGLEAIGLPAHIPQAALYAWARVPESVDEFDFCARLLQDTGVSVTPGAVFGQYGKGFIRISFCTPLEILQEGMRRMVNWMHENVEMVHG
ncbi:MAG: aminotransferase class I/II-fold pyridoxal phosphate-dependent enzyme [Anaerolineales bacterium]|nr:aminotransferase class I/II-fold pyridoxal phosphate-dependent enzyme [Anaerolineales bacterium]